jgi:hypothetical protein
MTSNPNFYNLRRSRRLVANFALTTAVLVVFGIFVFPDAIGQQVTSSTNYHNGLSDSDRHDFYHTAEGSELFPLSWMNALEDSETQKPFTDNWQRFGLIPDPDDSLPIGLSAQETRDTKLFGPMVGVNCAACHVSELNYGTTVVRIDGAPNLFSLNKFDQHLFQSASRTMTDAPTFFRFFKKLVSQRTSYSALMSQDTSSLVNTYPTFSMMEASGGRDQAIAAEISELLKKESLKEPIDLSAHLKLRSDETITPQPTSIEQLLKPVTKEQFIKLPELPDKPRVRWSSNEIGKKLAAVGPAPGNATSNASSASLSLIAEDLKATIELLHARVAFLEKLTKLPSGTPAGYGRVDAFGNARNIIFSAQAALPPNAPVSYPRLWALAKFDWLHWDGNTTSVMERNIGQAVGLGAVYDPKTFVSTLRVHQIHSLELLARQIQSPKWPAEFGSIDPNLATTGKGVYQANCASCHSADPSTEPDKVISLDDVGTDATRSQQFNTAVNGIPFPDAIATFVKNIKTNAYSYEHVDSQTADEWEWNRKPVWRSTSGYAPRSLAGIWATAPYLHNNSVPTLADLLSTNRPKYFRLTTEGQGSNMYPTRQYDPVKVGPQTMQANTSQALGTSEDAFDTTLPGNSNVGHPYGTQLDPTQKQALIEYLKTL